MKEPALHMADIFMPEAPQTDQLLFEIAVPFAIALVMGCALYFVWRYKTNPTRKILSALKNNAINSRQAAHALAKLAHNDQRKAQLDQLRFSRQMPTIAQIMQCLKATENSRAK